MLLVLDKRAMKHKQVMNIGMNIDISSNMSMGTNTDMRHTKFAKCRVRICDYIYERKKNDI